MRVVKSFFVKSGTKPSHFPDQDLPEIAFGGRSNVGKSSLLNTIMNRRDLVRVSKRPGATQLVNFFEVHTAQPERRFSLVDLPGYGFAKVPKSVQRSWGKMIENYLKHRPQLRSVVVLMDIRRGIQDDDAQLIHALQDLDVPPVLVFTKADKLNRNKQKTQLRSIAQEIGWKPKDLILFSSHTGQGVDALWSTLLNVAYPLPTADAEPPSGDEDPQETTPELDDESA